MFDARLPQPINDLNSFFGAWNARGNTKTLNWQPFLSHLLPQRQLERKLTWIDNELRVMAMPAGIWD